MINNNKPLSLPTIPPPPLNNNLMGVGPSVQNQLNQQQINQTNQNQKEASAREQKQLETVKLFSTFQTIRAELMFRSFVSAELLRMLSVNRPYC